MKDEEEKEEFEKRAGKEGWIYEHSIGENGRGVTMMIKKKILVNGEIDVSFERDEEGRWIRRIKNILEEDIVIV